jgi:hypothetical protein
LKKELSRFVIENEEKGMGAVGVSRERISDKSLKIDEVESAK